MNSQSSYPIVDRAQTMTSQPSTASQISAAAARRPDSSNRHHPNGYPPSTANGYYQSQRQSSGLVQPQPQPQYLPQSMAQGSRNYPQPQRVDSRQPPPTQYNRQTPNRGIQPSLADSYKPIPNRGYPQNAALNSDPYRTQSLATSARPAAYDPPTNTYNQASASAFRQQPYQQMGASRTTAQGRIVPERHDERAMSMTSFSADRDHSQTMSGRVIPNRRKESGQENLGENATLRDIPSRTSTMTDSTLREKTISLDSTPSRTMSLASTIAAPSDRADTLQHRPSVQKAASSSSAVISAQSRAPLVYPALLSRVAEVFRERISAGDRNKNELSYKFAFTGAEAVDLISYIIKTTDRNLALLLGRALDAQKFFHDVTYDHRLRDSAAEIFQFRESLMEDPSTDVNGVFTLLTECYSPTCTRDRLCYSIACPRRLEQQARLNLKPQPGLKRQQSTASLHADETDEQKLWINTVSQEVADSVGDREKKRQEVISEIMYTERDFVKDLEYLRDFWMKPLRHATTSPIPERHRERFVRTVFSNCMEVHAVNARMADSLTRRQQENPVVRNVGDIFLEFVPRFEPFIRYGAAQLWGKFEFERERSTNNSFRKFVDETERLKESRKLELNGYLTKPTTRLARYPLLLENVLKYTADDNPDMKDLPRATAQIKEFLAKVNSESGKAENQYNLRMLQSQLNWGPGQKGDLKLLEENRELVYKSPLKKNPTDSAEILVYLFNHALLFARQKQDSKKQEELRVYKKPIPLELLVITQMDEVIPKLGIAKRPSSSLIPGVKANPVAPKAAGSAKEGFPITFRHIGRGGFELTLYALSLIQRRKWMEAIEAQQEKLRSRGDFYTKTILCDNFFTSAHKVNCVVPVGKALRLNTLPCIKLTLTDGGRKLVFGTDTGVYLSDRKPKSPAARPKRVLDAGSVTQIDVLEEYQLLLVLATKSLMSYPLEVLDPTDNQSPMLKRPKKIQNHANFFKAGVCMGRHLVCSAKMSGISTTIKVFEPMDTIAKNKKKPAIGRMFQGNQDTLKPFKVLSTTARLLNWGLTCTGILRPRRIILYRLPPLQIMRRLLSWLRSCQSRDSRNTAAPGSCGHIP